MPKMVHLGEFLKNETFFKNFHTLCESASSLLLHKYFKLTFDGKLDCVARSGAFRIDGLALVQTTFLPPDFL